jgi:hypothetical protein
MSTPRRRIVRAPVARPPVDPRHHQRLQNLRSRLEQERVALGRWMSRLKRAFHAVERIQRTVARMERQLGQPEA